MCEVVKEKIISAEEVIKHLAITVPLGINESNKQECFLSGVPIYASLIHTPL